MEAIPMLTATAAAVSAIGSIQAGQAKSDALNYNATVSQQNATNTMQVANANEDAQRRKNAYLLGEKRAGLLQAGIGTDGSASDVLEQSAKNAEMDALNIRYQGILQGRAFNNQGTLDRAQAGSALTAGYLSAGSSLLTGASNYLKPSKGLLNG